MFVYLFVYLSNDHWPYRKGQIPHKVFRKGKIRRLLVLSCVGVIRISFSFILNKVYMLWEVNTKEGPRSLFAPPTIYPGTAPAK